MSACCVQKWNSLPGASGEADIPTSRTTRRRSHVHLSVRIFTEIGEVQESRLNSASTENAQVTVLPQDVLGHPTTTFVGLGVVAALYVGVVLPAVWSKQATRRKAAFDVMDRILRFFRPRS
jgi:hypothetical protein